MSKIYIKIDDALLLFLIQFWNDRCDEKDKIKQNEHWILLKEDEQHNN